MKFFIITCTYNSANWLKKNIESVRSQSYLDWEHIFIDGFSNDETLAIIKEYRGLFPEKVMLYQSKPCGISNAMNVGIKKSAGDYLIHLHSDDSFYDSSVLKDINSFLNDKKYDWVYGKINVIDGTGKDRGIFPTKKIWQNSYRDRLGKYFLKFYNYIPHQAVFIKKQVFDKFGYFDEGLSSAMDPDFWLRIRHKTKWCFLNRIISNFSLHCESQTANLKMKEKNKANYAIVQKRYLNVFELVIAKLINLIISIKNKI